jgi:hypothetical protein
MLLPVLVIGKRPVGDRACLSFLGKYFLEIFLIRRKNIEPLA